MTTPILTYPEAVFSAQWPGWNAFLNAGKVEPKPKKKKARKKREGK